MLLWFNAMSSGNMFAKLQVAPNVEAHFSKLTILREGK